MTQDETPIPGEAEVPLEPDGALPIEDAYWPEIVDEGAVTEDDPDLMGSAARSLEVGDEEGGDTGEAASPAVDVSVGQPVESDDEGDADKISEDPQSVTGRPHPEPPPPAADWGQEMSAHRIAVELKRIEAEVRGLLEGRDPRRKRKLSGSRRWREMEEDIIEWRFTSRFDEASLARLLDLAARRNYLFQRLRFVAGTRTGWNS